MTSQYEEILLYCSIRIASQCPKTYFRMEGRKQKDVIKESHMCLKITDCIRKYDQRVMFLTRVNKKTCKSNAIAISYKLIKIFRRDK